MQRTGGGLEPFGGRSDHPGFAAINLANIKQAEVEAIGLEAEGSRKPGKPGFLGQAFLAIATLIS